jgi:putative transcriptional regulator
MKKKLKYKSDAFEAIHSAAQGMYSCGGITKEEMEKFDKSCLVSPPEIAPKQIKKIRENSKVSQPVFANYLNTSKSTIQKWETGAKRPSGMALKLLAIVQKHGLEILA